MTYRVRVFGDPVLKQKAKEVKEFDGKLARQVEAMIPVMYDAVGVGLAAPQVGIQQRFFVYDLQDETGPHAMINPEIVETSGECAYDEGCLSVPGMRFEITRPEIVTARGFDIHGKELVLSGDDLLGRLLLHEVDHLNGLLLLDRLNPDERKEALRKIREQGFKEESSESGARL